MFGYGYVYLYDCTVKNDLKVKDVRLNEGMKVDLIANRRGLMLKSGKFVDSAIDSGMDSDKEFMDWSYVDRSNCQPKTTVTLRKKEALVSK